jgi:hypothetical protein
MADSNANLDPFETASVNATPTAQPQEPSTVGDYASAVGKGIAKGGASLLDMFVSPVLEDFGVYPKNPEESGISDIAERRLPSETKEGPSIVENTVKEALGNAPFGASGIASGAVGSGVTAWRNSASPETPIANTLWGVGVGALPYGGITKIPKAIRQGAGRLAEDNPILQAQRDTGVTARNAGGIGQESSWRKLIRMFRESPFSNAIENREAEGRKQLDTALTNQTGTPLTKEEAGTSLQNAGNEWASGPSGKQAELATRGLILNRQVDPSTTMVDMGPAIQKLTQEFTPPPGAPQMDVGASGLLQKVKDSVNSFAMQKQYGPNWQQYATMGYKPSNQEIPLAAVQYIKRSIGDDLKDGILANSDLSVRNNEIAYGTIARDAESRAYAGTPYANDFKQLQLDWSDYFNNLKTNVTPIIKNGVNAGPALDTLLNQSTKGGQKIADTLKLLPDDVRSDVANFKIRQMSTNANGQFDPATFANNWDSFKKISPEAKEALFGNTTDAYDKLALVAREQARSEGSRNASGTGGVNAMFDAFRTFSKYAVPAAGVGAGMGAAYNYQSGNNKMNEGAEYGGAAGAGVYALGMMAGPRLFSNPAFVRLLATNPPIMKDLPVALRALAANQPQIAHEVTAFQNYVTAKGPSADPNDPFEKATQNAAPSISPPSPVPTEQPKSQPNAPFKQPPDSTRNFPNARQPSAKDPNYFTGPNGQPAPDGFLGGGAVTLPDQVGNTESYADGGIIGGGWPQQSVSTSYSKGGINTYMNGGYTVGPNAGGKGAQWQTMQEGFNEGGYSLRNYALGGLTDTHKPVFNTVMGYLGGGSVWSGPEPIPFLEGGPTGGSSIPFMQSGLEAQGIDHASGGYIGNPKDQIANPFKINSVYNQNLAQGGISHNVNDPRPFYNPQLPRVTGGGWADGGAVNESHNSILDQFFTNDNPLIQPGEGNSPIGARDIPGSADKNRFWNEDSNIAPYNPPGQSDDRIMSHAGGGPVGSPQMNTGTEIGGYANGGPVLTDDDIHKAAPILVNQVMPRESGGKNIMNYIGDSKHTAQGYFQITNTNWRHYAPLLGIQPSNAMASPFEDQLKVAALMYKENGISPWDKAHGGASNYNESQDTTPKGQPQLATSALAQAPQEEDTQSKPQEDNPEVVAANAVMQQDERIHPMAKALIDQIAEW